MPTLIVTRLPVIATAINDDSVLINGLSVAIESLNNLVQENFQCSICLHNCTDARVVPECLHRFCGNCIEEGIGKCGNECPSFGTRITSECDLRLDTQFDNIVSKHHIMINDGIRASIRIMYLMSIMLSDNIEKKSC